MPGTITPGQMFTNRLDAKKGWPSPYAVDKRFQAFNGSEGIKAGMGVYLDPATGKGKKGAVNGSMPLFAWQGQTEFDVNGDVGNIISNYQNGLVAIGAYELETTEFELPATYAPNDVLTVGIDGKLKKTTLISVDMIVGVVSEAASAASTNENGIAVLRFWPVYLPKR